MTTPKTPQKKPVQTNALFRSPDAAPEQAIPDEFQVPADSQVKLARHKSPPVSTAKSALRAELPTETPAPAQEPASQAQGTPEATPPAKEEPKYDEIELAAIFDEMLFQGEYTEDIVIRGRLPVTLATRSASEVREISRQVDALSLESSLISTVNEYRSLLNLQYALRSYGNKNLAMLSQEDREKFIGKLPSPVIGALIMALSKFDSKVFAACKDGEENF